MNGPSGRARNWAAIALAAAWLIPWCASAQGEVVLGAERDRYPLESAVEVLVDERGDWKIDDVTESPLSERFRPSDSSGLAFGWTRAAVWVRFRVRDLGEPHRAWRLVIPQTNLNYVDFYRITDDSHDVVQTGNRRPFSSRQIRHPSFVFVLPPSDDDSATLYLRFRSETAMIVTPTIWSVDGWARHDRAQSLVFGLFYGVLLVMLGYNLILFLSLREPGYGWLAAFLFLAVMCALAFDGLLQQYFLPRMTWTPFILLSLALLFGTSLLFAMVFLRTRRRWPEAHHLLVVLVSGFALIAALTPVLSYTRLLALLAPLIAASAGTSLFVGLVSWRRGDRSARTFTLAWAVLLSGFLLFALLRLGASPTSFATNAIILRIGFVLLPVLLSLALADYFGGLRREEESAQSERFLQQQDTLELKESLNLALQSEIDERENSETERGRLIAELEAQNAELERFTYTVSHDLKTPLVTIQGFVDLLQKDFEQGDSERMIRSIEQIRSAAEKMTRLLRELLELSRIGRLINPTEEIELSDLALEAAELTEAAIRERSVIVEIDPLLPVVVGDRMRLLEVFQNLIENAVKFIGDQPEPRIEIGVEENADEPVIYVRDNGMGIEPEHAERVFGLFDRLDHGIDGTGIGLALVRRIVEVHGGRVWVDSAGVGHGSVFRFTLPGAGGDEPDSAVRAESIGGATEERDGAEPPNQRPTPR